MGFEPTRLAAPPPQDGESTNFSTWPLLKKSKDVACNVFVFCDPTGARTQDPIIKSDVLYRLSYRVKFNFLNAGANIRSYNLFFKAILA